MGPATAKPPLEYYGELTDLIDSNFDEVLSLPLPAPSQDSLPSGCQPLVFERNDGQTDAQVAYINRASGYTLFLTGEGAVLALPKPLSTSKKFPARYATSSEEYDQALGPNDVSSGLMEPPAVLRMRLIGATTRPVIEGEQNLRATVNYFLGNDPSRWRTSIPTFGKVRYREVYPGIDLVFYGNEGQLEYDFEVAPGADPNRIAMEFQGADEMRVDERGDLVLKVGHQEVRWQRPFIYQELNGFRQEIVGSYQIGPVYGDAEIPGSNIQEEAFVSFTLAAYDPRQPLVIDPRLIYSTYLGGSEVDAGRAVAADRAGNAYVVGRTASLDYPVKGAVQSALVGDIDVFVSKFSPAGELLFSTYLGGSGNDDRSSDLNVAVSSAGECHVVGTTASWDFPLLNPIQPWYGGGDDDAFVFALTADGAGLLFSTLLGGEERDGAKGVALDSHDRVMVVGHTRSTAFPATNAFQPILSAPLNGEQPADIFITCLEPRGESIVYSTFHGSRPTQDIAYDVALDNEDNAYVSSWISCYFNDCAEWWVTKVRSDGSLVFNSRLYPTNRKNVLFPYVAVAPHNRVVVAGGVYNKFMPALNQPSASTDPWGEAYVAQLKADDGAFISGVYLGGSGNDQPRDVAVTADGEIVVVGLTTGPDYQPSGFPVTAHFPGAPEPGTSTDVFITKFRPSDMALSFSTLVGGFGADDPGRVFFHETGTLLVTGYTSGEFPTKGAFQDAYSGGLQDAFLFRFSFGERLKMSRSGQTITISWPALATGFVLESADSPQTGNWSMVPTPPVMEGDQQLVVLPVGDRSQFFRLRSLN